MLVELRPISFAMSRLALRAVLSEEPRLLARSGRTKGLALLAGSTELEESGVRSSVPSAVVLAALVPSGCRNAKLASEAADVSLRPSRLSHSLVG